MSISCSNITYSREGFWTVSFIWLWSLFILAEPLPVLLSAAAFPKYQAAVYILCATLEFTYKNEKPKPRKEKPYKDLLVWFQCFYKAKVAGGAAVPAGWGVLGAAGSWARRGFLRQGYGQGIQQQIWDHFEKLWGCTKQDIVSAHFPWSSPRWQQFPVLSAGKMMLTLVQGGWCGVSCAGLWSSLGRVCVGQKLGAHLGLGWQGVKDVWDSLWASLKARYQSDLNTQQ